MSADWESDPKRFWDRNTELGDTDQVLIVIPRDPPNKLDRASEEEDAEDHPGEHAFGLDMP